ncbi:MAG: c-type cytochrome [Alphaproteobacteria bacterium]|nr:c-type cytochrome [Alphaproteobacteria bacterium]
MDRILIALLGALAASVLTTGPAAAADPEAGQEDFATYCGDCHSTSADMVNRKGPSLFGIVGRKAGTVPGFEYSDANRQSGWVWDEDRLRGYLPDPRAAMPGTKMKFDGVADSDEAEDIIAFLATRK